VKLTLLEFPTLRREGGDSGWCVLEETWSEDYGIPTRAPNQSGRTWCSAAMSIDMRAEETLAAGRLRAPIGQNLSTVISTAAVGPTQTIPHDLPRPPEWVTPQLAEDLAGGDDAGDTGDGEETSDGEDDEQG
jgi:hypothetical protein